MRTLKKFTISLICTGFLINAGSCAVFEKKDNGKHKGWYKNTNNPHNPASKKQTGKAKGKG